MARVATVRWQTPPPTSIDEELAIYDDGTALLVVRSSRSIGPSVGTWRCTPDSADLERLLGAGPGPIEFDLLAHHRDPQLDLLAAAADRVAATAVEHPVAVATFHARALGPASEGRLSVALTVVGSGERAVEFEIDPERSAVLFTGTGHATGWSELSELVTGFVTPAAVGLGGLQRRAEVAPGAYGAIAIEVPVGAGSAEVVIRVAGWLSEALPDQPDPDPCTATTASAPIPG